MRDRRPRNRPDILHSVGRPLSTAQVKLRNDADEPCTVGEIGEILVQAEQCMKGYWRDEEATAKALAEHCRQSLAAYKTPKRWVRTEALPLNASGKVDKPLLRRQYGTAG